MPPWLRLHTKCLAELNTILSDPAQVQDESCYQTVLFLYRLSVRAMLNEVILRGEKTDGPRCS